MKNRVSRLWIAIKRKDKNEERKEKRQYQRERNEMSRISLQRKLNIQL